MTRMQVVSTDCKFHISTLSRLASFSLPLPPIFISRLSIRHPEDHFHYQNHLIIIMASVPNETTSVSSTPTAFSIAIIGGGIGGLTLAIGLLKYPHIDVQIYESAPSFGEIGAGITIGPNAQRAFELIGNGMKEAFTRHATPNLWASHYNNYTENRVVRIHPSIPLSPPMIADHNEAFFLSSLVKDYICPH